MGRHVARHGNDDDVSVVGGGKGQQVSYDRHAPGPSLKLVQENGQCMHMLECLATPVLNGREHE